MHSQVFYHSTRTLTDYILAQREGDGNVYSLAAEAATSLRHMKVISGGPSVWTGGTMRTRWGCPQVIIMFIVLLIFTAVVALPGFIINVVDDIATPSPGAV